MKKGMDDQMFISTVSNQLISIFLIMLVGYLLTKWKLLGDEVVKGLSMLLSFVGLPASVISGMQVPYSRELLGQFGTIVLGFTCVTFIGIAITIPVCMLRRIPLGESGAWINCVALTNCIFVGRPIMMAIYGDTASFPITALIFSFNILTFSIGIFLVSLGGNVSVREALGQMPRRLLNPTVIAGFVGLAFFLLSVRLPAPVINTLDMLGAINTPLSMLVIGYSLALIKPIELFNDLRVYIVAALRLLVCPVVALLVLGLFIHDPVLLGILVLVSAMPTASIIGVLSEQYNSHPAFCSKAVFLTTLLCFLTIPLIARLL